MVRTTTTATTRTTTTATARRTTTARQPQQQVPLTQAELLKQKGEKAIKDEIKRIVTHYIDNGLLKRIKEFYETENLIVRVIQ